MNILKILLDYLRWHFFSLSSVSYVFMNAEKKMTQNKLQHGRQVISVDYEVCPSSTEFPGHRADFGSFSYFQWG